VTVGRTPGPRRRPAGGPYLYCEVVRELYARFLTALLLRLSGLSCALLLLLLSSGVSLLLIEASLLSLFLLSRGRCP
jgi:hypothetical protein